MPSSRSNSDSGSLPTAGGADRDRPEIATLPVPASSQEPAAEAVPRAPPVPRLHEEDEGFGTGITTTKTLISSPASGPRLDTLTMTSGPDEGRVFPLRLGNTWLGRSGDCEIVVLADGVSRRHACISVTPSLVTIRDNKAKNGTRVNDRALVDAVELRPGDEIQIGGNATFLYSRVRALDAAETRTAKSIASMVAGVAHQLNTPLGVAYSANALIESLADELRRDPTSERVAELLGDLQASAGLVTKNLERTNELVKSFKQLSVAELMAEHREHDLAGLVTECVAAARPTAERQGISLRTDWPKGTPFPWVGFPAAMSKVVEHLLQNSLRYAYKGRAPGAVDIRLKLAKARYRLEIEDYGVGVPKPIQERIFEPFVSSDNDERRDGLGLAVVHMIVTTLFGGNITCRSIQGEGTKFILVIPAVVAAVEG